MKTTIDKLKRCCLAAFCAAAPAALAQTYNWLPWTIDDSQHASTSVPDGGSVGVSVHGAADLIYPVTINLENDPFAPAPAIGPTSLSTAPWTIEVNLASLSDTTGLILGLGNFGHDFPVIPSPIPIYRLTAFDRSGALMPLTGFTQIGSYDHRWTFGGFTWFNDDVSLNPATGIFEVITTPGHDDNQSDIAVLSLPAGVGRMEISTIGQSGADQIGVLVAPVPEPGAVTLMLLGVGALVCMRWRACRCI